MNHCKTYFARVKWAIRKRFLWPEPEEVLALACWKVRQGIRGNQIPLTEEEMKAFKAFVSSMTKLDLKTRSSFVREAAYYAPPLEEE